MDFTCPACQRQHALPSIAAGRRFWCQCGQILIPERGKIHVVKPFEGQLIEHPQRLGVCANPDCLRIYPTHAMSQPEPGKYVCDACLAELINADESPYWLTESFDPEDPC